MRTTDYLDRAKVKLNISSDYELDKVTGMGQANISNYRRARSVMDDYNCAKIAEILEISPLEVIAAANAERERDEGKRAFWEDLRERAAAFAVFTGAAVSNADIVTSHGISALTAGKTYPRAKKKLGGEGGI